MLIERTEHGPLVACAVPGRQSSTANVLSVLTANESHWCDAGGSTFGGVSKG